MTKEEALAEFDYLTSDDNVYPVFVGRIDSDNYGISFSGPTPVSGELLSGIVNEYQEDGFTTQFDVVEDILILNVV